MDEDEDEDYSIGPPVHDEDVRDEIEVPVNWWDSYQQFNSQAKNSRQGRRDIHDYAELLQRLQRETLAVFDKSWAAKQSEWCDLTEEADIDDPGSVQYLLSGDPEAGARAYAEKNRYSTDRQKLQRSMENRTLHYHLREFAQGISAHPDLSWKEIEIRFLDDFKFQAIVRDKPRDPVDFATFGLKDTRGGGAKPSDAWKFFRSLPSVCGTQIPDSSKQRVQKLAQRLRNALKSHFNIHDDPLPFVRGHGYRLKFSLIAPAPLAENSVSQSLKD